MYKLESTYIINVAADRLFPSITCSHLASTPLINNNSPARLVPFVTWSHLALAPLTNNN